MHIRLKIFCCVLLAVVTINMFFFYNYVSQGSETQDSKIEVRSESGELPLALMDVARVYVQTANRNTERRAHLRQACTKLGYPNYSNFTNLRAHMDPDKNMLYCRINKCASTFTLTLLSQLFQCDTDCLIKNGRDVSGASDALRKMLDAFSFIFVRDPYRRLFSTYCNIFYMPKEDWFSLGRQVIKAARKKASKTSRKFGHDLTFFEMIKYTVEFYERGMRIDAHVRPMSHVSCDPCLFDFDFIGKVETLDEDFEYMLMNWSNSNILQIQNNPKNIVQDTKRYIEQTKGPIGHLYKVISKVKGSSISVYSLMLRTWSYFQMTGVISKTLSMPFNEHEAAEGVNIGDYLEAVKIYREKSREMFKDELKGQREESMLQAYSTVPLNYMERLRNLVYKDCLLFGYDDRPASLFNLDRNVNSPRAFKYFKGL